MRPSLYTIPGHLPFLDALVAGLLAESAGDPLSLSRALILLPTRRACRALREAFLRASEGRALLLPQMRPVGDLGEDELDFAAAAAASAADAADIAPAAALDAARPRLGRADRTCGAAARPGGDAGARAGALPRRGAERKRRSRRPRRAGAR